MKPNVLKLLAALLLAPLAALHAAEPPFPAGIEHVRVERSDSDRYQFLHDPAIELHKGELFVAWYNCPLARPATIPRARVAETRQKAISYHLKKTKGKKTASSNRLIAPRNQQPTTS